MIYVTARLNVSQSFFTNSWLSLNIWERSEPNTSRQCRRQMSITTSAAIILWNTQLVIILRFWVHWENIWIFYIRTQRKSFKAKHYSFLLLNILTYKYFNAEAQHQRLRHILLNLMDTPQHIKIILAVHVHHVHLSPKVSSLSEVG